MERAPARRDSRPLDAALADEGPATPAVIAEAPPGVLAKLGRVVPGADTLVRFAYGTALASSISVGAIVWAVLEWTGPLATGVGALSWGPVLALAAVLLTPALAAALVGWTLADLVRLPGQLRQAALAAAGGATGAAAAKGSRIARVFRAIWAARGLARGSKDAWLRAIAAARLIRLASLPFVLALVGLFALNGVVIVAGLVAVAFLVL